MSNLQYSVPDSTAVRVALWRAMHVQIDNAPYVLEDEIGLKLVAPDENWKQRPDMHPMGTRGYRASIVGRARFIEDLVAEKAAQGIKQYVILGAGLDTFVQRKPHLASQLQVFEVDQHQTQEWKRKRLEELGYGIPNYLRMVSVDFEQRESWKEKLIKSGFDPKRAAVIVSTGVAMYLSKDANCATLSEVAKLAPGSTFAMSFLLPPDLIDPAERTEFEKVCERAKASGTPFVSLYRPQEILDVAANVGFKQVEHISRDEIIKRYFAGRPDRLVPASGEEILLASI